MNLLLLFSCYVLSIFNWLFAIFLLFSECQLRKLSHFYSTCIKRVLHCHNWSDVFFEFVFNEVLLNNRCALYWNKYLKALVKSKDGELLAEQLILNLRRNDWLPRSNSPDRIRHYPTVSDSRKP